MSPVSKPRFPPGFCGTCGLQPISTAAVGRLAPDPGTRAPARKPDRNRPAPFLAIPLHGCVIPCLELWWSTLPLAETVFGASVVLYKSQLQDLNKGVGWDVLVSALSWMTGTFPCFFFLRAGVTLVRQAGLWKYRLFWTDGRRPVAFWFLFFFLVRQMGWHLRPS